MKRERRKGKGKRIKDGMKNGEKKGVRRKSKRGRGEKGKGKGKRIKDGMKNAEKEGVRRKSKRGRDEKGKGKGEREEDKGRYEEWGEGRSE